MSSSPASGKSRQSKARGQKKKAPRSEASAHTRFFYERGSGALRVAMDKFSSQSPFPPHKVYKLPFSAKFILTTVDGGTTLGAQVIHRLNSLFDPEASFGGHQPYGFDALAVAYNRYKVLACRVKITLTDPSADGMMFVWCIFNPSNASGTIAGLDPSLVLERQQAGGCFINNTGSQTKTITLGAPIGLVSGLTKLQFDADPDNFTAPVTADPGNVCMLAVAVASIRAVSPAITLVCNMEMEFEALFYQRKLMAQS